MVRLSSVRVGVWCGTVGMENVDVVDVVDDR